MMQTLFTLEHNAICDRLRAEYPAVVGRGDLPAGPPDQRRADREDPHDRVDARRHRPPHDPDRDAGELVRPGRRAAVPAVRPHKQQRDHQRHPRLADRAVRRAVLAHRGVRGGLPDASAGARRLQPALQRRRPGADAGDAARPRRARTRSTWRRQVGVSGPAVLVRHPAPRAGDAAQLPAVPAGVPPPGRQPSGPRRDGHPAVPRAGRAALQRVPQAAALSPRPPTSTTSPTIRNGPGRSSRSTAGTSRTST